MKEDLEKNVGFIGGEWKSVLLYVRVFACLCVRWNILPHHTKNYLRSCNRENDDLCPIFRVGDIVSEAHKSSDNHDDKFQNISVKAIVTSFTHFTLTALPHTLNTDVDCEMSVV